MGKAFKCDVSGEIAEGDGRKEIDAFAGKKFLFRVTPFIKVGEQKYDQATVSEVVAEVIRKAIIAAIDKWLEKGGKE